LICLKRSKLHLTLLLLSVLVLPVSAGATPDETGSDLIPDLFVSMKDSDKPSYALVVEKSSQLIMLPGAINRSMEIRKPRRGSIFLQRNLRIRTWHLYTGPVPFRLITPIS